jgi:DNA polymerase III epsilon subunit-like protein
MSNKLILCLQTDTNGLHKVNTKSVSKKNLYGIANLLSLNYLIGYRKNGEFIEVKKKRFIIKPKNFVLDEDNIKYHNITNDIIKEKGKKIDKALVEFQTDMKDIAVVVSHSLGFHINAILGECMRNCVYIDFSKKILIDTMTFQHSFKNIKLKDLAKNLLKKSYDDKNHKFNLVLIKKVFMELYKRYESEIQKSQIISK